MTKWEYAGMVYSLESCEEIGILGILNALGEKGWELIEIKQEHEGTKTFMVKRPVIRKTKQPKEDDLKPCPYCGSDAQMDTSKGLRITCNICGCSTCSCTSYNRATRLWNKGLVEKRCEEEGGILKLCAHCGGRARFKIGDGLAGGTYIWCERCSMQTPLCVGLDSRDEAMRLWNRRV